MLATNQVQSINILANTKVVNILTRFIIPTRFVIPLSQITLLSRSDYYPKPRNTFFPLINKK